MLVHDKKNTIKKTGTANLGQIQTTHCRLPDIFLM